jgi:cephalosporin-C deacetylase
MHLSKALIQCFTMSSLVIAIHAEEIKIEPVGGTGVFSEEAGASWQVSVSNAGSPVTGDATYSLKSGGLKVVKQGTLQLKNGTALVNSEGAAAGTLLLEVARGSVKSLGGAVVNPSKITVSAAEPADFDAFWKSKIAELEKVPMDVVLEKIEVSSDVDYWKITLGNIRGSKVYGQIARPKKGVGKLPAVLQVQYAGLYPLSKEWVVSLAKSGWLAMNIIAHDLPIDREKAFYDELNVGKLAKYSAIGNDNRDTSYFLRMYLGAYRAVEYLKQHPDWDGKVLHVDGASQGGLQAIVAAALNPAVTAVTVRVPAGCDHTGELVGRAPGWPEWVSSGPPKDREKRIEASKYYDAVNFARRVKCPTLVAVGLIDTTSDPEGVIAMYNQLSAPKRLMVLPFAGHAAAGNTQAPYYQVLDQWRNALKAGEALPMSADTMAGTVLIDDKIFSISGPKGWFSTLNPSRLGGEILNVRVDKPAGATLCRNASGVVPSLAVGSTLALSFDIARSAGIGGDLRVYVGDASASGYAFRASLGASIETEIFHSTGNKGAAGVEGMSYGKGKAANLVGDQIASNSGHYQFTIERVDADTLKFEVSQNGGAALASLTKNYDGVDQPAADLLPTLNRIYIGWGNTGTSTTDSIQLDHVLMKIYPSEALSSHKN